MPIIIPSKNIYEIDNSKIRDNIIDRIEVLAKDVLPNNDYNAVVYNQTHNVNSVNITTENIENYEVDSKYFYVKQSSSVGSVENIQLSASYAAYKDQKTAHFTIRIPLTDKNKWINSLYTGVDGEGKPRIKISLTGIRKYGRSQSFCDYDLPDSLFNGKESDFELYVDRISYSDPEFVSNSEFIEFREEISITDESHSTTASQKLIGWGNLAEATPTIETIGDSEYYVIDLDVMAGIREVLMDSYTFVDLKTGSLPGKIMLDGIYILYEVESIQLTFYGNTIGIQLQDKTIYIPDKNGKKPYSIDGNEIIQTSNHFANGESSISSNFLKTLNSYKNGKETATLRCSISDYYDENGEKVIDIKGERKSFHIQDKVIPMVYGADGKDQPMSKIGVSEPKVFEVVGSKIFYDGAVWQTITIQEA
jgi:hypothetical protein